MAEKTLKQLLSQETKLKAKIEKYSDLIKEERANLSELKDQIKEKKAEEKQQAAAAKAAKKTVKKTAKKSTKKSTRK
jgi:adenylate kinase